ncbi:SHOCT domain-containing protein [Kitasatospora sp. HPMI-4]|uniref:SHOCT domain-containing protein n=1 Tax=Kitasatospora sp. HPMI-4 TaxID=3448443 RepID=UPI003F1A2FE4
MTYWYGHGPHLLGFGVMVVGMLLVWALLVLGIVALIRYLGRSAQHRPDAWTQAPPTTRPGPEQLLAERFARGEIDADEYRRRLEVLRSDVGPTGSPGRPGSTGPTGPPGSTGPTPG